MMCVCVSGQLGLVLAFQTDPSSVSLTTNSISVALLLSEYKLCRNCLYSDSASPKRGLIKEEGDTNDNYFTLV